MTAWFERNIPYLAYAVLGLIFVYLSVQNLELSENWAILSFREIDDYAMQASVLRMQKLIYAGEWAQVFSFTDYAYGTGFWILNSLLLMPFHWLGNAQWKIVAGREISLIFGFVSIVTIGHIAQRVRDDKFLKYAVMLCAASMPVLILWSLRLHVNTQFTALGLLSFYFLIRNQTLSRRDLVLSALLGGFCIGFKFTGALILPLLGGALLFRVRDQPRNEILKNIALYAVIGIVATVAATCPILLAHPWFPDQYDKFVLNLKFFKNLGTPLNPLPEPWLLLKEGVANEYLGFGSLAILVLLYGRLIFEDLKLRNEPKRASATLIAITLALGIIAVTLVIRKGPVYSAAYFLGVGVLLPVGLMGLATLRVRKSFIYVFAILFIVADVGFNYQSHVNSYHGYFHLGASEKVRRQVKAYEDITALVPSGYKSLRVLRDCTAVAPRTQFDEGVTEEFNYWNLASKKDQIYDYIVLNSVSWMFPQPKIEKAYETIENLTGIELEAATRQILRKKNEFYGKKYELVYDQNDIEMYRLRK